MADGAHYPSRAARLQMALAMLDETTERHIDAMHAVIRFQRRFQRLREAEWKRRTEVEQAEAAYSALLTGGA